MEFFRIVKYIKSLCSEKHPGGEIVDILYGYIKGLRPRYGV